MRGELLLPTGAGVGLRLWGCHHLQGWRSGASTAHRARFLIPGDSEHDFKTLMACREQTELGPAALHGGDGQPACTLPCSSLAPAACVSCSPGRLLPPHTLRVPSAPSSLQPGAGAPSRGAPVITDSRLGWRSFAGVFLPVRSARGCQACRALSG